MSAREPKFYVSPPLLPSAQKKNYVPAKDVQSLKEDARVDEVIGEYFDEDKGHFYFARYAGGIAHKFHAAEFERKYDALVKAFRAKKNSDVLPEFDPNATYVHPLSRPKTRNAKQGSRAKRVSRSAEVESVYASEEEGSSEYDDEEDEEYDEDEESMRTPPRSVRPTTRKELPFSPRKTRSTHVAVIESDSEASGQSSANHKSLRRSTRSRKAAEIILVSDDDSDEDYTSRASKVKAQRAGKKRIVKSVQPMYGRFRDIATLDEDPFSDDEGNEVLRLHRKSCEKCYQPPAHSLLEQFRKKSKRKGKKRKRSTDDEFEDSTDEESFTSMGGWVQCLKCVVSAHWKCIGPNQRDEVLRAAKERDRRAVQTTSDTDPPQQLPVRRELEYTQVTEFLCGACSRGGICNGCSEDVSLPTGDNVQAHDEASNNPNDPTAEPMVVDSPKTAHILARELLFRCLTCKRPSHYRHLPMHGAEEDEEYELGEIAFHYQKRWLCADCSSYTYGLDKIIAWRPYPSTAVEKYSEGERPNYKAVLPREYLVKWENRSYRRLDWVPHMWLLSTSGSKLKNFITGGTKVEISTKADDDDADLDTNFLRDKPEGEADSLRSPSVKDILSPFDPLPDAEKRIPRSWKTVDRVLDVLMWIPDKYLPTMPKGKIRRDGDASTNEGKRRAMMLASQKGEEPSQNFTWTAEQWHNKVGTVSHKSEAMVAWAFIKWEGLGYDECSWDAPPQSDEPGHAEFRRAFERYIMAQKVFVPKQSKTYWDVFDRRNKDEYRKRHILEKADDLVLGQPASLKLMPFQVDGFNWLCNNWWNHQHCILADEMGLGKTVQIVTFLGNIISCWNALPALVVVPNSTITNWVREFERWAPNLRVVPFSGEKAARDIIIEFELFHKSVGSDNTKAKFHVLITTYETLTGAKDFTAVFKNQPRWEVLVVDEGQRLKSDSSLLFRKLNELNTAHRIIMTGTPLNNNIRELFNLMNFLDPDEWGDLAALEKEHETLSEELVKQLHTRLRPYFLRRIKSEVLDLPPKNEVIVPVSMAPLQREVYKSILTHNLNILNGLTQPGVGASAPAKSRINNVLMQLRKCLQHPYLYAEDIEPRNLGPSQTHAKLIDGSAKLRFLKTLLPKLKERGHRVLLFSQFVIALNIVEDFLTGEGYKFLRLDGNTRGNVRQKLMDDYNKPGSEYFIFLLTTRAGGVGINLFSADTVIIFDPDFNPHQDLQAIARAYRYGQEKTCLVFKLIVKESAEERIMQIGKKKLVLDHLIVQKMDDNDENGGEDIQSILTYGAQSLFQSNEGSRDIHYSEQDIVRLIEKTEKEAVKEVSKAGGGLTFSFAKIWAADKDSLDEVVENDQKDSWAQTLAKINEETAKQQAIKDADSGRGSRRKAADIAKSKINGVVQVVDIPKSKTKAVNKAVDSDGSAYSGSDHDGSSIENDSDHARTDGDFVDRNGDPRKRKGIKLKPVSTLSDGYTYNICGLCKQGHGPGDCKLIEDSARLAELREMLILNADDEPWEDRQHAVVAIDELLHARGDLALISGQPLHPLPKSVMPPTLPSSAILPPRGINTASAGGSSDIARNSTSYNTDPQASTSVPVPKKRNHGSTSVVRKATGAKAALPNSGAPLRKKLKTSASTSKCSLCGSNQVHNLEKCPFVLAGPKSISDQIVLLERKTDFTSINLLQQLRTLLQQSNVNASSNISNSKA